MNRVEAPIYVLSEIQALEPNRSNRRSAIRRALSLSVRHLRHAAAEEIDDSRRVLGIAVEPSARAESEPQAGKGSIPSRYSSTSRRLPLPGERGYRPRAAPSAQAGAGGAGGSLPTDSFIPSRGPPYRARPRSTALRAPRKNWPPPFPRRAACRCLSDASESSSRQAAAKSAGESAIRMSSMGESRDFRPHRGGNHWNAGGHRFVDLQRVPPPIRSGTMDTADFHR